LEDAEDEDVDEAEGREEVGEAGLDKLSLMRVTISAS
jgi:hypothetical protein